MRVIYKFYKLSDPRTEAPKYVGRTLKTLNQRLSGHISSPANGAMKVWIDELKSFGLVPLIDLLEECVDYGLHEAKWITYFTLQGYEVLNQNGRLYTMYFRHPLHPKYNPKSEPFWRDIYPDCGMQFENPPYVPPPKPRTANGFDVLQALLGYSQIDAKAEAQRESQFNPNA